ncbi:hypothetical protein ACVGVM_21065 [Pseudonocardia bannensis]|uniref:Polysaccharide chain length determinant N-terminal domain-containing protein n=1 Tax=Pseudonocardia bannensis TaxID=630973 RepID=A0A848DEX3_9PSEU|nr:hypothetical protein [Pseudonocardia bannensis]NMH91136.1 hypothetical protein [Pseudonocardia bannensis]
MIDKSGTAVPPPMERQPGSERCNGSAGVTPVRTEDFSDASPVQQDTNAGSGSPPRRSLTAREIMKLTVIGLVLIMVGASGSYGVALLLPKEYLARTELLYTITTAEPTEYLREDRTLTTQVLLIEGRSVLGPVATAFGLPVNDLAARVNARVVESSKIIEVQVVDPSPDTALRLVEAIRDKYLDNSTPLENKPALDFLNVQLADVRERQRTARPEELLSLAEREAAVLSQIDNVRMNTFDATRARTVVPAYALDEPVSPRPAFAGATGGLTAMLVATAVIALLARRWTRC